MKASRGWGTLQMERVLQISPPKAAMDEAGEAEAGGQFLSPTFL